ncbi:MAG TPA: hypothetical protein DHW39_05565 [Erysipelotrichaceae bacterium]|nr:hypothetical protein [Erysipelotrichaceae bacterium]
MNWINARMIGYGILIGTAGVKALSGRTAKKVYTHVTAAALRCYDDCAKTYEAVKETCGDILADAREINDEIYAEEDAAEIEEAKALLESLEAEKE